MLTSLAQISGIALPSRYDLLFPLAAGGTASVHLGRLRGIAGFWRLVAVKVAHAHLNEDPQCREMMVDEARLASKIHHPNVVPVIDIDDMDGKLLLVMEYIEGASLSDLLAVSPELPARIAIRVALDACAGLHAAHTLSDATGRRLGLVHRDVSPQNILLGTDGVTRLTDFGIAKTAFGKGRSAVGALKGKLAYMAPEYVTGRPAEACSDVFGLAVVVWEMLAGRRLFRGENGHETLCNVLHTAAPPLSTVAPDLGEDLSSALAIALSKVPEERFRSARMFGAAIEVAARKANLIATTEEVAAFVTSRVGARLEERRARIAEVVATEPGSREQPRPLLPDERDEITSRAVPRPRSLPPYTPTDETTTQQMVPPRSGDENTETTQKHRAVSDDTTTTRMHARPENEETAPPMGVRSPSFAPGALDDSPSSLERMSTPVPAPGFAANNNGPDAALPSEPTPEPAPAVAPARATSTDAPDSAPASSPASNTAASDTVAPDLAPASPPASATCDSIPPDSASCRSPSPDSASRNSAPPDSASRDSASRDSASRDSTPSPVPSASASHPVDETSTLPSAHLEREQPRPAPRPRRSLFGGNRALRAVAIGGLLAGALAKLVWFSDAPGTGTQTQEITAPPPPAATTSASVVPSAKTPTRGARR